MSSDLKSIKYDYVLKKERDSVNQVMGDVSDIPICVLPRNKSRRKCYQKALLHLVV